MSDEPKYYDIDGKEVPLLTLVRSEPEWAANIITLLRKQRDESLFLAEKGVTEIERWKQVVRRIQYLLFSRSVTVVCKALMEAQGDLDALEVALGIKEKP